MMDTETTPMITPNEIKQYLCCPRLIYFMDVMKIPRHEEKRYKVLLGRRVHKERLERNRRYLRTKIGAVGKYLDVYLASSTLRVRGIVDEIVELNNGTLAPLDYKFTKPRITAHESHRIQLIIYGLLIRETFRVEVDRGFIVYVRDDNKLTEIRIDDEAVSDAIFVVENIFRIIEDEVLPRKTKHRGLCPDCTYRNICV